MFLTTKLTFRSCCRINVNTLIFQLKGKASFVTFLKELKFTFRVLKGVCGTVTQIVLYYTNLIKRQTYAKAKVYFTSSCSKML